VHRDGAAAVNGRPALDATGLPVGYPFKPDLEVTPRQAREMLEQGAALLVDVRTPAEVQAARIKGAVDIPLGELGSRLGEIEKLLAGREDVALIVHCHVGGRSMKAALFLRERGLEHAKSMAGGIEAWSLGVDAAVPRYERSMAGAIRIIP
jgi:rhodanese-related sulfurtransferase